MSTILEIVSPSKDTLPTCSAHLMPFCIKYTGPAPISTYFRPKPVPAPTYGKVVASNSAIGSRSASVELDSQTPEITSQSLEVAVESSEHIEKSGVKDEEISNSQSTKLISLTTGDRFVAAFRGRTVHGTQIELPEGYSGILLKGPEDGTAGESSSSVARQRKVVKSTQTQTIRTQRRTRGSQVVINVDEEEMDYEDIDSHDVENDATSADEDNRPVRPLALTSKFSSFVVWSPDIPVDEGRDEYLRSLSEWTKLTAEIHLFDY